MWNSVKPEEKSLMRLNDLPRHYDPKLTEDKWYQFWLKKGFFHADEKSKKRRFKEAQYFNDGYKQESDGDHKI